MLEQEKLNEMINLANQNGVDKATVDGILNKLSESDKKKVNDILSDKQKLNQILSNSNLKDLLNRLKMDDLSSKITDILNDPEQISKLKSLASGFLNNNESESKAQKDTSVSALPFNPSQMSSMISVMNALGSNKSNDNNTTLLLALKPHLSPERRKKVDTAITIMKIIKVLPIIKESGLINLFGE